MKSIEQRIAIAKATGDWRDIELYRPPSGWNWGSNPPQSYQPESFPRGRTGKSDLWMELPDYLNDLNVMAKVEEFASAKDPLFDIQYETELLKVIKNSGERRLRHAATAEQRAEAFLKTLGLWRNDS